MPRAEPNCVATFYGGPASDMPGAIRWTGPARFVPIDGVFQYGPGHPETVAWVTFDEGAPIGSWVPGKFAVNPELSDQVAIDFDDILYWVVFTEHVVWNHDDYFRAVIAELPLPDFCACDPLPPPEDPGWYLGPEVTNRGCSECEDVYPAFLGLTAAVPGYHGFGMCGETMNINVGIIGATVSVTMGGVMGSSVGYTGTGWPTSPITLTRTYSDFGTSCNFPETITLYEVP